VLSSRENGSLDEALAFLNRESERLIGIDGSLLEMLPTDAATKLTVSGEHTIVAARVLEEIAQIREEQGEPDRATSAGVKAFALYAAAARMDPAAADGVYRKRIVSFGDACADRGLTEEELRALMQGYETLGAFSRAEDALFALLDIAASPRDVLDEGLGFYHRLYEKNDEELADGGLPRDEISDGIAELKRRAASI